MKNKEKIFVLAFFLFVPLFLFRDSILPGKVFDAFDIITLDMPFRMFAQDVFFRYHQLPFWLPGILSGIPLIDSTNLIYFYPFTFIMMALNIPVYATYTADVIFHMLLGAWGMYLFLKACGLNKPGSIFGALSFMTGGIFVSYVAAGHMGNIKAAAFISWIFYFFNRGFSEKKMFWYLSAGLCMGLQVLCIGMQVMAYAFIAAAFYLIYLNFGKKISARSACGTAAVLLAAAAACVAFSAPQFFASVKYLKHSWRWDNTYELFTSWSFHPAEAITFILPQFYGIMGNTYWGFTRANANTFYMGVIPFLLAPAAFINRKRRGYALFFGATALFFLILGFGGYTPLYRIFYYIPIMNFFRTPNRFLYIFTFCMIVLAATGLSNIFDAKNDEKSRANKCLVWTLAASALLTAALATLLLTGAMRSIVSWIFLSANSSVVDGRGLDVIIKMIWHDTAALAVISAVFFLTVFLFINGRIKRAAIAAGILCAAHFIDTAGLERHFINYVPVNEIIQKDNPITDFLKYDRSVYRIMEPGYREMINMNLYDGIESLTGYHGFSQAKYLKLYNDGNLNNTKIDRMMNVRYYISDQESAPDGYKKVYNNGMKIYMDPGCLPRFYVTGDILSFPSDDGVYAYLTKGGYIPGQAVLAGHEDMTMQNGMFPGSVDVLEYTPSRIKLDVIAGANSMLVFSNYYYESWKALVDKNEEKIYNVNYLNSGIALKPGRHSVDIYFDGWYIYAGIWTALLALLAYFIFYFYDIKGMRIRHGKGKR
jgi:hypothetical protein